MHTYTKLYINVQVVSYCTDGATSYHPFSASAKNLKILWSRPHRNDNYSHIKYLWKGKVVHFPLEIYTVRVSMYRAVGGPNILFKRSVAKVIIIS
jgi:hypothetical protein